MYLVYKTRHYSECKRCILRNLEGQKLSRKKFEKLGTNHNLRPAIFRIKRSQIDLELVYKTEKQSEHKHGSLQNFKHTNYVEIS